MMTALFLLQTASFLAVLFLWHDVGTLRSAIQDHPKRTKLGFIKGGRTDGKRPG